MCIFPPWVWPEFEDQWAEDINLYYIHNTTCTYHILIIYLSYTYHIQWKRRYDCKGFWSRCKNLVAWKQARCSAWQDPQKFSKSKHFKVNLGSIKSLQAISILQEQRGHWRIDLSDHFILYKTLVGLTWTQDEKLATHQYSKYLNTKLTWWIHVNTVNTFAFLKFHIVACCFGGSFLSSWPCDESHTSVQQLRRTPKESWCTSARSTRNNEKDFAWLRHVGMSGKMWPIWPAELTPTRARLQGLKIKNACITAPTAVSTLLNL